MAEPVPEVDEAELDRAIIDASRGLIAAIRARPRDTERITAAQAEYDALVALKASRV